MRRFRFWASVAFALATALFLGQFAFTYFTTPRALARVYRTTPLPIGIQTISTDRLAWLLAVQDPNFFRHPGVDFFTPGAGHATITDRLVEFILLGPSSGGVRGLRKVRADVIALAFNRRVPKMEQLRLFVNTVYLGSTGGQEIRGFDKASRLYFNKSYNAITDEEYLRLVAMILMPGRYHVVNQRVNNTRRFDRIRRLLHGDCAPAGHADVEYPDCEVTRL